METDSRQKPPCPVCGSAATFAILHRPDVPVHQNLLLGSAAEARDAARGDLALRLCPECGCGFNSAFRPELLDYGQDYDNTQSCSPAFDGYLDDLARELVCARGARGCRVVEVGCGKGAFLRKLIDYPESGNVGHGFDPTYLGPEEDLGGRVRFTRSFYGGAGAPPADLVVCRHVLEHVADPLGLLRAMRGGLPETARVFLETPCLEWILRHGVLWDFFYEHCSLFTAGALTAAVTRAGFGDVSVEQVFGGQYLWLHGRAGGCPGAGTAPSAEVLRLARTYALQEQTQIQTWRALVARWAKAGPVAVWGAGAKGVTFCNLVDPECRLVACAIDVNPAKQGKYVAGTGHRILGPEELVGAGVAAVLVLNPNYLREITEHLARLGSRAVAVDGMEAERRHACA